MKDERYWPVLGTWLKDTAAAPPDPEQTARKVAERLPQTPQVRRRWWLPSSRRTSTLPSSNDQATDHPPTVSGRTRLMFSPVKAITAGALVFALGGAFLITQPFDQQGEAVPGAETPEPTSVQVTVTQQCSDVGHSGCDWTASDPRLTGRVAVHFGEGVEVPGTEDFEAGWQWIAQLFNGPEGGWTGHVYALWGEPAQNFMVLSGNRAFEGWHYIASGTDPEPDGDFEWIGTLYEGELPPFPEAPAE